MNNQHAARTKFMVELALMVAIIFVMAFTPLGYFQTMGLSITFLTVPVAVGAIILGPKGGAICGLAFGITRSEERRVGKECRSRWSPYH